jgi:hypothetical protein
MDKHVIRRSFALKPEVVVKDLLEGINPETVVGAILFLAPDLDCHAVTSAFDRLFPYAGCTFHSAYSHKYSSKMQNQTAVILLFMGDNKLKSGLVETFTPGAAVFAFSLNDDNTEQHIQKYRMLGGVASENYATDHAAIWTNYQYLTSGTVAMSLPPNPLTIEVGKGWVSVDSEIYKVTRANGYRLFELNGIPVRNIYEKYIAVEGLIPSYPLMIGSTGQTIAAIRYEQAPDGECLIMSRPVPENEQVQFCTASRTAILHESHEAALRSFIASEQYPREFGLAISCTSRAWFLSDMEHMEFNYIQKFSGDSGTDNIVVYLNGEFEPTPTGTKHHNHSLVIAAFYSVDCDLISEI